MTNPIYDEGGYAHNIVVQRVKSIIECGLPMKERFEIENEIFYLELELVEEKSKIYVHVFSKTDDGGNTINRELMFRFRLLARMMLATHTEQGLS